MKARIILSTSILVLGIVLVQTGCESRKKAEKQYQSDSLNDDKTAYDTVYKSEQIAEPVLAESERHFDAAVKDLDLKNYQKAATEIKEGITAIKKEGAEDKGELKAEFKKSVVHLQDIQKRAAAGKLTSADLKKAFWPAEMMVTHYKIEKWESIPEFEVKTNDHLREALDGLERKTADLEASTRDEGKKLIAETRAHLKAAEQNAGTDAGKAKADLRLETARLKAYIKKNL